MSDDENDDLRTFAVTEAFRTGRAVLVKQTPLGTTIEYADGPKHPAQALRHRVSWSIRKPFSVRISVQALRGHPLIQRWEEYAHFYVPLWKYFKARKRVREFEEARLQ